MMSASPFVIRRIPCEQSPRRRRCRGTLAPFVRRDAGPGDEVPDDVVSCLTLIVDGTHRPPRIGGVLEEELLGGNTEVLKETTRAMQGLLIGQGQPKSVDLLAGGSRVRPEIRVAADHSAQIAEPVVRVLLRRSGEPSCPHQLVITRQVRASVGAVLRAGDVLPSAVAQESVIAACDQLSAVLQADAISWLGRFPVRQHFRRDVPTIGALDFRAVNGIADAYVPNRLGAPICHENWRFAVYAIGARMTASSVGIYRPGEWHP